MLNGIWKIALPSQNMLLEQEIGIFLSEHRNANDSLLTPVDSCWVLCFQIIYLFPEMASLQRFGGQFWVVVHFNHVCHLISGYFMVSFLTSVSWDVFHWMLLHSWHNRRFRNPDLQLGKNVFNARLNWILSIFFFLSYWRIPLKHKKRWSVTAGIPVCFPSPVNLMKALFSGSLDFLSQVLRIDGRDERSLCHHPGHANASYWLPSLYKRCL